MDRAEARKLAQRILEEEGALGPSSLHDVGERACERLSLRLSRLLTATATAALLQRGLHLASVEFPFLGTVQAGSTRQFCLDGLLEALLGVDSQGANDAVVMIVGNFLELVSTFIGDSLTLSVVQDVWSGAMAQAEGGSREAQA